MNNSKKMLGFWMCTAMIVGNIIGSGIFMLPASLAPFGLNSIWAWLLTATGSMILALIYAKLAQTIPTGGGPYHYVRSAFGTRSGFLIAWSYWVSIWFGVVAIATACVSYLSVAFPLFTQTPIHTMSTILVLIWLITILNYCGTRKSIYLQTVSTILKIIPLLLVVIFGFVFLLPRSSFWTNPPFSTEFSTSSVSSAATLTLWAFFGFESASVLYSKVHNPARTIPRATICGMICTTMIYLLTCSFIQWFVPQDQLAQSSAPFADVMRIWWGDSAAQIVAMFAAISALGALTGWILLNGEMPFVLAKDGMFPALLAKENRFHVPGAALLFASVIASILVLMNFNQSTLGIFNFMILISTSACLYMYLFTALAAIKLLYRGQLKLQGFAAKRFLILCILGFLYSMWMLYGAGIKSAFWGIVLMMFGQLIYWAINWRHNYINEAQIQK